MSASATSLLGGFQSWQHFFRFCAGVLMITMLALFVVVVLKWLSVEVTVNTQGATTIHYLPLSSKSTSIYQLSPARVWANTGIVIPHSRTITVKASGSINLGQNETALDSRTRPRIPWCGPEGFPYVASDCAEQRRRNLFIVPEANAGALIGFIATDKAVPRPGHFKPEGTFLVVEHPTITYRSEGGDDGVLYLTVNDTVVEDTVQSEQAFVTDLACLSSLPGAQPGGSRKRTPEERLIRRKEKWRSWIDQRYWDVYFEDNAGSFLVEVQVH